MHQSEEGCVQLYSIFFENLEKDTEMDGVYQGVNIKEAASE